MVDEPSSSSPGDPGGHSYFQNFQHTPIGARVPEKIGRGVFATALMVLQTNEIFVLDMLLMASQPQQVVGRIVMTAGSFSQFLAALRLNVQHYESEVGPLKARLAPPNAGGHSPQAPIPPSAGRHSAKPSSPTNSGRSDSGAGPAEFAAGGGGSVFAGEGFSAEGGPPPDSGEVMPEPPHGHSTSPSTGPITELYEQVRFPEELLGGSFANAVMIRHTPEEFCFDFISSLYPRPVVVCRVYAAAGRVPSFIDAMAGSLERFQNGQ